MENSVHCSLIMHGFHNGKWLILCSKQDECLPEITSFSHHWKDWKKAVSYKRTDHRHCNGFKTWLQQRNLWLELSQLCIVRASLKRDLCVKCQLLSFLSYHHLCKATITRCDLSATILFKLVDSYLIVSNSRNNVASIQKNRGDKSHRLIVA